MTNIITYVIITHVIMILVVIKGGYHTMTKKATITKEIIVNAAFEIARTEGEEYVNARSIAKNRLYNSACALSFFFGHGN